MYTIIYDWFTTLFPEVLTEQMEAFCRLGTYVVLGLLIYCCIAFVVWLFKVFSGAILWK